MKRPWSICATRSEDPPKLKLTYQGSAVPTGVYPRLMHTLTYDLARKRLVLFGGTDDPNPGGRTFGASVGTANLGW